MRSAFMMTAFVATLSAAPAMSATVLIDDFQTSQVVVANSGGDSSNAIASATSIGGSRTVSADYMSGPLSVTGLVYDGVASASTDFRTLGTVEFAWDAGGVDLTDGLTNDGIRIGVEMYDLPGITYSLSIGGVTVSKGAELGNLDFSFADFLGVDFTNVGAISLLISGPESFDTGFSFIEATNLSPVPLPAAGLLLLGGLGGLGLARRKS